MTEPVAATTTTQPPAGATAGTMRRDVLSAYLASAARVGSWVIAAAIVMRAFGARGFALLALVRGVLSILNYGTIGLGPAMVHHLARRDKGGYAPLPVRPAAATGPAVLGDADDAGGAGLSYAGPTSVADPLRGVLAPLRATYGAGLRIAGVAGAVSAVLLTLYALYFDTLHDPPYLRAYRGDLRAFVLMMGLGALLRLVSDAPAAVLQVRDRITLDNVLQACAELMWIVGVARAARAREFTEIGLWFTVSGAFLLVSRLVAAARAMRSSVLTLPMAEPGLWRDLLATGGVVVLGQLADYLYAPANLILINRLLDPELVAYYAPALQIDGALLLLVSALGAVLMPKAAVAHAADERERVWNYYLRGTLASLAMLAAAAVVVVALSPWIFPLWLGQEMRTTRAILPLVMIHTVIGGSGAVGRSILIAIGRAKAFTIAALVAGVANVVLAYVFAARLGWGLKGIALATVIVVVARAGIWQPWYVRRALRGPRSAPP